MSAWKKILKPAGRTCKTAGIPGTAIPRKSGSAGTVLKHLIADNGTMKKNPIHALFRVFFAAAIGLSSLLSSCAGVEEPSEELPEPPPAAAPLPERKPVSINWAGTTWIIPDSPDKKPKNHPDYRGFHLGSDGKLFLINLDTATGNEWSAQGNRLSMSLLSGRPEIPLEGAFLAFSAEEDDEAIACGSEAAKHTDSDGTAAEANKKGDNPAENAAVRKIRLVPEAMPDSEGLILQRAEANKDLVFNHWVPMALKDGETVHWPANREVHLMLLSDGAGGLGILGYGGENRFHGPVNVGMEDFIVGAIAMTKKIGLASEFENLYVGHIDAVNRYVQVRDELYLYRDTLFLVSFSAEIFD